MLIPVASIQDSTLRPILGKTLVWIVMIMVLANLVNFLISFFIDLKLIVKDVI